MLILVCCVVCARGQLPQARLHTIFPPGGTIGQTVEVTVTGADLEELKELWVSDFRIKATLVSNKFNVTIDTNAMPGIREARAIGRFGASNPRRFLVDSLPQVLDAGTNQAFASAQAMDLDSAVAGRATAGAVDFFKVKLSERQNVIFHCEARHLDSRMQPVMFLLDAGGKELARARTGGKLEFKTPKMGEYVLKLHDLQFRGGEEYWYRLAAHGVTSPGGFPASELAAVGIIDAIKPPYASDSDDNDSPAKATALELPAVVYWKFFPARDVDWYRFEAKAGKAYWIEVVSQRLGLGTDPMVVIERVTKNDKGEEQVAETQEVYDFDTNPGGAEFNMTSRDPMHRFEAKEGSYRVQVRDLFNQHKDDVHRPYHLVVKEDGADFALIAAPVAPPPLNRDLKEATPWGLFLRRGDMIPIRVLAYRKSGFNGEIALSVEGLPPGVTAAPAFLKPGANVATLMLQSNEDVAAWSGAIKVIGKSGELSRTAQPAAIRWHVGDYNNEMVQSYLAAQNVLAVSGSEATPITIRQTNVVEAIAGAKVLIPLSITRRGEFNQPIKFRVFTEPVKEFEVDGKATNAVFEIDLGQLKLAAGQHWFPIHATSPGKYSRTGDGKDLKDVTATIYSTFGVNVSAATAAKAP